MNYCQQQMIPLNHGHKDWSEFRVTRLCDFAPIGLLLEEFKSFFFFLEARYAFLKSWSSPNKWWHFRLLFAEANLLHFHLNKQFQIWCDFDVLGFQMALCCRFFGLFLGMLTFWKIGIKKKYSGHSVRVGQIGSLAESFDACLISCIRYDTCHVSW